MNNTVSIVVPVYNVNKYIINTIESVRNQTYSDWELVLVEDGSTDGTVETIQKYIKDSDDERIRLILLKENIGPARARNIGVKESVGRYITYLDSDDVWVREKLEKQIKFMTDRDAGFCFTGYEFANEDAVGTGKVVKVPATIDYKQALKNTTIFTSTVMFDTTKIDKQLIEMPDIKSEDTALWWKILRQGYTGYGLNENLVLYRRSANTLSSNKFEAMRRIWKLYRRSEGMNIFSSAYNFCFWAVNAVLRRV